MTSGRGTVLVIMLMAVVALAVGETSLSKGMKQIDRLQGGWIAQTAGLLRNGWVAAGLMLLLVHLGLYMLALKGADLSFALPLTAASYPLAAILARFYLHEEVGFSRVVGTLLITVGVAVVAVGEHGGRSTENRRPATGATGEPEPRANQDASSPGPLEIG